MNPELLPVFDWLVKLTLLLTAAYALSRLLRRSAAIVRHRIWMGALFALFIGPIVAQSFRLQVPILPASLQITTQPEPVRDVATGRSERSSIETASDPQPVMAASPWRVALIVWLVVTLVLIARLVWSAAVVRRILSRGRQLTDRRWTTLLYETADRLGMDAVPVLFVSDRTSVPLACRFHRPAIVLPAGAAHWSDDRLKVVLLHELAHVKRRDLVGHTMSRLACAMYWFHPLVWIAAQRLRGESERACDDLALRGGARPSDYAQQLLEMVAELRADAGPATAMAMAANHEFEGRIVSILDPHVARQPRNGLQAVMPFATIVGFGLALAIAQPSVRAVAIAQTPDRSTVAALPRDSVALRRMLQSDPSAEVRVSAAWSMHQRQDAVGILVATLRTDRDAAVREMAVWSLGQIGDTSALPALYAHLPDERAASVRATTAWAIGQLRGPPRAELLRYLSDRDVNVLRMTVWAIGQSSPRNAPAGLAEHLRHSDGIVRLFTALSLGDIADSNSIASLRAALAAESDTLVRLALFRGLFESGDRSSRLLDAALASTDPQVRLRAAQVAAGQKPRPWPWMMPLPNPRSVN